MHLRMDNVQVDNVKIVNGLSTGGDSVLTCQIVHEGVGVCKNQLRAVKVVTEMSVLVGLLADFLDKVLMCLLSGGYQGSG